MLTVNVGRMCRNGGEVFTSAFGQKRTSAERFTEGAGELSVTSLHFLELGKNLFRFLHLILEAVSHFLISRFDCHR